LLLPDGADDHIHIDLERAVGNRLRSALCSRIGLTETRAHAFQSGHHSTRTEDAHRLRLPQKIHAVFFGQLIFIAECRHFVLTPPVDEVHGLRSKAPRGGDHINRGVPRADASNSPANSNTRKWLRLRGLDKFKRAAHSVQVLAGNLHGPSFAQTHSDKDAVEIFFELLETYVLPDFHFLAELDAQRFHHFDLTQRIGDTRLVCRDAVCIQSAGKFSPVKHNHAVALSREMRRARQGRRPRTDAGHAASIRLARVKQSNVAVQHMVHSESLQPANLDRLLAFLDHDARAFAQHFRWANSS